MILYTGGIHKHFLCFYYDIIMDKWYFIGCLFFFWFELVGRSLLFWRGTPFVGVLIFYGEVVYLSRVMLSSIFILSSLKLKMSRIFMILRSVAFKRILVIFAVGLVSRVGINYACDINVFKEYTNVVSLIYYGFMACFVGYISDLPNIGFNVFDYKVISSAIKHCYESLYSDDKMKCGGDTFVGNKDKIVDDFKVKNNLSQDRNSGANNSGRESSGESSRGDSRGSSRGVRRAPAAVQGLYHPDFRSGSSNSNGKILYTNKKSAGVIGLYESNKNKDYVTRSVERSVNSKDCDGVSKSSKSIRVGVDFSYGVGTEYGGTDTYNSVTKSDKNSGSIPIGYEESNFSNTEIRSRVPRAPRPSNYSTPSTMSPLFPASENYDVSSVGSSEKKNSLSYFLGGKKILNKDWDDLYRDSYYSSKFRSGVVSTPGVDFSESRVWTNSKVYSELMNKSKVTELNNHLLILEKYGYILERESLQDLNRYEGSIPKEDLDVLKYYKNSINKEYEKHELSRKNKELRLKQTKNFGFNIFRCK